MHKKEKPSQNLDECKQEIKEINARNKEAGIRATIFAKGMSLYLKFKAPPKPGSATQEWKQYDYALNAKANSAGIKKANAMAKEIGGKLEREVFNWSDYMSFPEALVPTPKVITIGEAIEIVKFNYFNDGKSRQVDSFNSRHRSHHNKLKDREQPLTEMVLREAILKTPVNSSARRDCCLAFKHLGEAVGIQFDFSNLAGTYSDKSLKHRDLPSDELIVKLFNEMEDLQCKWMFGMMACFGIRNHETFHINLKAFEQGSDHLLEVTGGKTGARQARAYHPEWIERFDLRTPKRPDVASGLTNCQLGTIVGTHLKKEVKISSGIPFRPYDLRHAWAVRTMLAGVPMAVAAREMGHSVEVHTKRYHHWINKSIHDQAYDKVLSNPNRILPPP